MQDIYWNITKAPRLSGYLASEYGLPSITCESCSTWSYSRLHPSCHKFDLEFLRSRPHSTFDRKEFLSPEEFSELTTALYNRGERSCFKPRDVTAHSYSGFHPGDDFGNVFYVSLKDRKKDIARLKSVWTNHMVFDEQVLDTFIGVENLSNCWAASIKATRETDSKLYGLFFDPVGTSLEDINNELRFTECSACHHSKIERNAHNGPILSKVSKSLQRSKCLPAELTNAFSDVFKCDYISGIFISEKVRAVLSPWLNESEGFILERYDVR